MSDRGRSGKNQGSQGTHFTASQWVFSLGVPLMLSLTVWVVRFWHSAQFGLYEDDLTIIPRAIQMSLPELVRFISNYIVHLYGHARPLSDSMIYFFSYLGWNLGGLWRIYWIGYLILIINVTLLYFLLRRLMDSPGFAVTGALAYALFSGDTTQGFLTHSLGLQPSLTFLLLSLHAYLSGLSWLAYPLASVILFSYESPFPIFLAAPLLQRRWDRQILRRIIKHVVLIAIIVALAGAVRFLVGEERVTELSWRDAVVIPISHMLISPFFGVGSYFLRPLETIYNLNSEVLLATVVASLAFTGLFLRLDFGHGEVLDRWRDSIRELRSTTPRSIQTFRSWLRRRITDLSPSARLFIAGFIMVILAYPLTFTTKAYHIRGRPTRVHAAAGVGSSIMIGAGATILIQTIKSDRRQRYARAIMAVWLGSLVGYGFVLQRDYVVAWDLQREFWHEIIPLIDDAGDGSIILVEPSGIEDTWQIAANTWNLPRVLEQLYNFPPDWEANPMVFRLLPGWEDHILNDDGDLEISGQTTVAPASLYRMAESSNVILIETGVEHHMKRTDTLHVDGQEIALRVRGRSILIGMQHGFLYELFYPSMTNER